jgi:endogenous inhibitor of DNA gyrase (YacG/DUF329 family)
MVTEVKCPACATPVVWIETSRWRPFCSERCKTIDLGAWAANRHVIAGNPLEQPLEASGTAPDAVPVDSHQPSRRRDLAD